MNMTLACTAGTPRTGALVSGTCSRSSWRCIALSAGMMARGVISSRPGMVLGGTELTEGMALLALSGIVPVKVTNEGGAIRPGDLLVSSSTLGAPCAGRARNLAPVRWSARRWSQ